jgi:anti-anti-sigma factor
MSATTWLGTLSPRRGTAPKRLLARRRGTMARPSTRPLRLGPRCDRVQESRRVDVGGRASLGDMGAELPVSGGGVPLTGDSLRRRTIQSECTLHAVGCDRVLLRYSGVLMMGIAHVAELGGSAFDSAFLTVQSQIEGDSGYVTCRGELDIASAASLLEGLAGVISAGAARVTLDLREVGFVDSSGLRSLIEAHNLAVEHRTALTLLPSVGLQRLMDLAGVRITT